MRRAIVGMVTLVALAVGVLVTAGAASSEVEPLRAAPGESVTVPIGPRTELLVAPDGVGVVDGVATWTPTEADLGVHRFETVTLDERGSWSTAEIEVVVRHEHRPGLYLALGDSVASGHGLDRWDYLGRDRCWRAEGAAYARHVADGLADRGVDVERHIVACSGAFLSDLSDDPVGGGPSGVVPGDRASQLEWAALTNPGLVTLTIGANDLGFIDPAVFFDDGGLDRAVLDGLVAEMEAGLIAAVDRLVAETDALVVVTNYHDPSAENPQGVDGCRQACFAAATAEAIDVIAAAVDRVAGRHPDRVLVADAASAFVGHGAGNGRGPDVSRLGQGPLSRFLPAPVRGVSSYCARGDHSNDTWINAIDCVHPNGEGQEAYADAVLAALDTAGWRGGS
ncbi:MAG: GDSL-type esterase/lipase family protein [Actinomycetota bacterium]